VDVGFFFLDSLGSLMAAAVRVLIALVERRCGGQD